MSKGRGAKFGKRLLKIAVTYAIFFILGQALALIDARTIGLSENMWMNLRMFFMLFGPIYLALMVKIILTFISAAKSKENDAAEKSRAALQVVVGLLLAASLADSRTASDLASAHIQGKGLRTIERSGRYSARDKRFLNVFLPVCLYLLILQALTLLVCIVVFEPLSRRASNAFIFSIFITAMLMLMIPLVMSFCSGFGADKKAHAARLEEQKQKAGEQNCLALESDRLRRKKYLRLPKILALLVCPAVALASMAALYFTKSLMRLQAVRLLRIPLTGLLAAAILGFIPLLMYWMDCSGTSLVQRVYLARGQLYYGGYTGSMDQRTEFTFTLVRLQNFRLTNRAVYIKGLFVKETNDSYGTSKKGPFAKTLRLARTFPPEQERLLLDFLRRALSTSAQTKTD